MCRPDSDKDWLNKIKPPWDEETVKNLNYFQSLGFVHPFTCVNHSNTALWATKDGWVCGVAGCPYTQDWAHLEMAEGEIKEDLFDKLSRES